MAAGLKNLLGECRDADFRYLSVRDPGTMDKLMALGPDIVIIEASERDRWEGKLLSLLSRGLIVSIDLDRSTLNCYYVRRDVPATVQELIEAVGHAPDSFWYSRVSA